MRQGGGARDHFQDARCYLPLRTRQRCFINTSVTPEVRQRQMLTFMLNEFIYNTERADSSQPQESTHTKTLIWTEDEATRVASSVIFTLIKYTYYVHRRNTLGIIHFLNVFFSV